jgi:hypothetical protein
LWRIVEEGARGDGFPLRRFGRRPDERATAEGARLLKKSPLLFRENAALFCKSPVLLQRRLRADVPSAGGG